MTGPREFRFSCIRGCIRCCDVDGYVYLTEQDLRNAARYSGMTPAEFERRYVYRTAHKLRLRKPKDRQCPFLEPGGCSIHPVKPVQCRTFPFWPEYVESQEGWARAGERCPGVGSGELVQIGAALEIAEEMKRAYPAFYPPGLTEEA